MSSKSCLSCLVNELMMAVKVISRVNKNSINNFFICIFCLVSISKEILLSSQCKAFSLKTMSCQLRKCREIVFMKGVLRLIWRNSMQVLIIFVLGCAQLFLCKYITYIGIESFHYPQKVIAPFK